MKKMLSLMLALLCCVTAFAALAEDHSGYTTGELLAMSAAIDAELSARISAGRTASPEADFIGASDGTQLQINARVGPGGDVVIPDETDGLPVTRIGAKAFYNDQTLTSVTFPSGLKEVGDMAFFLAKGLTGVLHIPASVEAPGANAFKAGDDDHLGFCDQLRSVCPAGSGLSDGHHPRRQCGGGLRAGALHPR